MFVWTHFRKWRFIYLKILILQGSLWEKQKNMLLKWFWDILPKFNLLLYIEFYKVFDIRDKIIFLPKRNQKNASK